MPYNRLMKSSHNLSFMACNYPHKIEAVRLRKNMNKNIILAMTSAFILIYALSFSYAHKGASGIVKQRMDSMKSIAAEMKKLKAMLFKDGAIDTKQVRQSAKVIKRHANQTPRLFPKGSLKHPSEASVTIWKNFKGFESEAVKLASYANALLESADNPSDPKYKKDPDTGHIKDFALLKKSAPQAAFFSMASTCQSCHQSYRVKK